MSRLAAARRSRPALVVTIVAGLAAPLFMSGPATAASVATWDKVAQCESSGNWSTNTGNGYYGGLQFSASTWAGYGGHVYASNAHLATKKQQILIAEKVLAGQGAGAWPRCGALAGLADDHADPYPPIEVHRDHDYTGDSKDDLLGVDSTGTLRLYSGNGSSGVAFTQEVGGGWTNMDKVAAADFNGDGDGDLVATNKTTGELFLYIGNGDGGFKSTTEIGHGWTGIEQLAAGDFTGDGKADIVAVNQSDATLNLYTGNGNGVAYTKQIGTGWSKMTNLAAGDFNGDNRADLVATREDTGTLLLYPGTTTGGVASGIDIGSSFNLMSKLTLSDLNNDGRADITAINRSTGDLYLYTSKSNSLNSGIAIGHGWGSQQHLI
ncbi:FG-GAP-like repeat-containing protein [Streptomyces bobili]|uniref:FG-GAP-like repeat-containing protein n=1 Tax=Streptomyces bobili TaxID=67280 RepID=UPI002B1DD167|nr:FG-GAP-like repeat-containing protein [Streptomyces bobili]